MSGTWGRAGRFLQITETPEVTVAHNTIFQSGPAILAYGGASPQFVFRDNILPRGSSGVFGHGVGEGTVALSAYFPGAVFARNVIAGANAAQYPPNNSYPSSLTTVGFVDLVGGNYGLGPSSPYRGMATDGTDIGCDFYHLGFLMP